MTMVEAPISFADATAYESFMGRWSRAVAPHFLRWMKPARGAKWLDVGCGTGILAEALLHLCEPASVSGIDSAAPQIEHASHTLQDARVEFRQADAMRMPFPDHSFECTVSALVLNFIAEPSCAVAEMRRVTAAGGTVAAYVWDFERELSPSGPFRQAMRASGAEVPAIPGTAQSTITALRSLFARAGLQAVESATIEVTLAYSNFDAYWSAQTPSYAPTTRIINAMSDSERRRLKRVVQDALPVGALGKIEYTARANAVRATVPL
jgi:ubiquinone/menaquinone biosynthesis C-methylase UbiE